MEQHLKIRGSPEFRCRMHQTRPSTLFSPIFSLAREKMGPSETRQKRPRRNESLQARPSVLVSSFPNRKLNLRFGFFYANLRQPLSLGSAEPAPLEGEPRGSAYRRCSELGDDLSVSFADSSPGREAKGSLRRGKKGAARGSPFSISYQYVRITALTLPKICASLPSIG